MGSEMCIRDRSIVVESLNEIVPVLVWVGAVGRGAPDSEDVINVAAIEK